MNSITCIIINWIIFGCCSFSLIRCFFLDLTFFLDLPLPIFPSSTFHFYSYSLLSIPYLYVCFFCTCYQSSRFSNSTNKKEKALTSPNTTLNLVNSHHHLVNLLCTVFPLRLGVVHQFLPNTSTTLLF